MEGALASLKDVEGVIGSFLIDEQGNLLARDMPSLFDDLTLSSASARLGRLRAAFENDAERFEGCTARFGAHLVLLRAAEARTLCVLCPVNTNLTMLEMGLNLIARRLAAPKSPPLITPPRPESPRPSAQHVPTPCPPAPPPRDLAAEDDAQAAPTRFFRGRPVR